MIPPMPGMPGIPAPLATEPSTDTREVPAEPHRAPAQTLHRSSFEQAGDALAEQPVSEVAAGKLSWILPALG